MRETSRAPPTVMFTVRLWRESLGPQQSEWRGEIKNLATGETRITGCPCASHHHGNCPHCMTET